jgi:hypothetical protein
MKTKTLQEEAEKYGDSIFGFSNENHNNWEDCQRHFIAGASSKYVQAEKLKFAIEQLKLVGNYFDVSKLNVKEHTQHIRFTSIIQDKINALKQQLKELEG